MNVRVSSVKPEDIESDLLAVGIFSETETLPDLTRRLDARLGGIIAQLIRGRDLAGKVGETAVLYPRGSLPSRRVILLGLGAEGDLSQDALRRAAAALAGAARNLGVLSCHLCLPTSARPALTAQDVAQSLVEGMILGNYAFTQHKTDLSDEKPRVETLTLVVDHTESVEPAESGAARGKVTAEATCLARDLVNGPANFVTPTRLAEVARSVAQDVGLRCQVLEEADMAELGMGALLGVAQGSNEPAKFIILEHNADREDLDTYVVVGKGITFDSGGISLKPSSGMEAMKNDMSGAAATLGILQAVGRLDLPLHVVGLLPATENLPGGRAYKPGDVLKSMSGLTVEVVSTDAEGRLVLADALTYAARYQPKAVVDLATLTGACVTALGNVSAGLMATDDSLVQGLMAASQLTGEKVWQLPLFEEYGEQIRSDVADVKNVGGRPAGAITAGLFLSRFAEGYCWAHLDIAGLAQSDKPKGYLCKGATGFGVRLVLQWLRDAAES